MTSLTFTKGEAIRARSEERERLMAEREEENAAAARSIRERRLSVKGMDQVAVYMKK